MNLLPKSREQFSEKEYWDSFFKKRGTKAFEWYGEYPELSEHLHKYIKQKDDVLITGCGNSTLGRDLYDIGYHKITNIDISHVVIKQMLSQNEKSRSDLKYLQMDALAMTFEPEQFSVVLDKGTLDALMPDDKEETQARILKYFKEIERVLKMGGRYICISLLQEHILKFILNYFPSNNWMFRAVRCFEAENKASENDESTMPVFMVVCTKFKALPRQILELNLSSTDKMERFENVLDIINQITSVQQAAFLCSGLKRTSLGTQHEVSLDLYKPGDSKPRFTVHVVDGSPSHKNSQYAAFIVPQGREAEWLFSTSLGRKNLIQMTKTNRLAVVTMHRGQSFGNFDEVQNELSSTICNLAPAGLTNKKIPFLSLGSDVGKRTIKYEGNSQFSGDYVVEDVEVDNEKYRRLYYLSSQLVIQSEAKLKTIKTKKGSPKEIVDLTYLTCNHHIYMSISTNWACKKDNSSQPPSVAIIGLGGGGLCSFLHKFMPQIKILAVDIDSEMLKVASEWFGLSQEQNIKVTITDGLDFLKDLADRNEQLDVILFDVDSKDSSIGMSCPPKQFLEMQTLQNVSKIIKDDGLFIVNVVLRDETLRSDIVNSLSGNFRTVVAYKLEEDLNEIFVCMQRKVGGDKLKNELKDSCGQINKFFSKNKSNESVDVDGFLAKLNIIK